MKPTKYAGLLKPEAFDLFNRSVVVDNIGVLNTAFANLGVNKPFDSTTKSSGVLAVRSGITVTDQSWRRFGPWGYVNVSFKVDAGITLGTGGSTGTITVADVNPDYAAAFAQSLSSMWAGRAVVGYMGIETPRLVLSAACGNSNISGSETLQLAGFYYLETPSTTVGIAIPEIRSPVDYQILNNLASSSDSYLSKLESNLPQGVDKTSTVSAVDSNIISKQLIQYGNWAYISVKFSLKTTVSLSVTGDMANTIVASTSLSPKDQYQSPLRSMGSGRIAHGYMGSGGGVVLTAVHPGNSMTIDKNTDTVELAGWYRI